MHCDERPQLTLCVSSLLEWLLDRAPTYPHSWLPRNWHNAFVPFHSLPNAMALMFYASAGVCQIVRSYSPEKRKPHCLLACGTS